MIWTEHSKLTKLKKKSLKEFKENEKKKKMFSYEYVNQSMILFDTFQVIVEYSLNSVLGFL